MIKQVQKPEGSKQFRGLGKRMEGVEIGQRNGAMGNTPDRKKLSKRQERVWEYEVSKELNSILSLLCLSLFYSLPNLLWPYNSKVRVRELRYMLIHSIDCILSDLLNKNKFQLLL